MSDAPPPPVPPPPPPAGGATPGGLDPADTTPHQLHPLSMLAGIDPRALVFTAIALVGVGAAAVTVLPFLAVGAAVRLLQWQRFRYGFDGTVVKVQQGVLQQRTRSIDVARIQQVEVDQPLLHRIAGLAVLRLETASEGGETEVELAGIGLAEAERLRTALRRVAATAPHTDGAAPPPPTPITTVLEVPLGHLALSAVTGAQLLALPAALVVLGDAVFDIGAQDDVGQTVAGLAQGAGLAVLLVAAAVVAFGAAVAAAVLRDGGYRVALRGDDLLVSRGLLTTRQVVLPRHRVQVVEVRQNWLRRALGMATVAVRSAGGGAAKDEARRIQVPLVRVGPDLDRLLDTLVPGRPPAAAFRPHPRVARRRSVVRAVLRVLVVAVPAGLVAVAARVAPGGVPVGWPVPATLAVLALAAGPVLGIAAYRHLAHALGDRVLASRHGTVGVITAFAPLARLQGVTQTDSPFQRRLDLASVHGHLAGAGTTTTVVVLDVDRGTAGRLRDELAAAAAHG